MVVTSTLPKASDHDYTVHLVLVFWPTFITKQGRLTPILASVRSNVGPFLIIVKQGPNAVCDQDGNLIVERGWQFHPPKAISCPVS